MLLEVTAQYPGLPDVRELTERQIRFFYEGIRSTLRELTKPQPKPGKR